MRLELGHSPATPRAERWILAGYWLLSGYGQRAARAIGALLVLIATVALMLIMWGGLQWTGSGLERAAQISLGAVVFRDAGQQLTTAGSWTVTIARIIGPVLLALAVLAIRARVKR